MPFDYTDDSVFRPRRVVIYYEVINFNMPNSIGICNKN